MSKGYTISDIKAYLRKIHSWPRIQAMPRDQRRREIRGYVAALTVGPRRTLNPDFKKAWGLK